MGLSSDHRRLFVNGLALAGSLALVFVLSRLARTVDASEKKVERTLHVGPDKNSDPTCAVHGLKYASWDLTVPPVHSRPKEKEKREATNGPFEGLDVGVVNR